MDLQYLVRLQVKVTSAFGIVKKLNANHKDETSYESCIKKLNKQLIEIESVLIKTYCDDQLKNDNN